MPTTHPDATAPDPEWLFKADGQVCGPVPESRLVALILEGRVGALSEVAPDGGAWRLLRDVPGFLVHLRKAEARARVVAEVTGARKLAARRGALRWAAIAAAGLAAVALVGGAAWYLAVYRPWARRSALLADLGDGIAFGAVHIGSRAQADEEVEVPLPAEPGPAATPSRGPARPSPARPRPRPAGDVQGGVAVLARYDPARIQQVVARNQPTLAGCVREEVARSPDLVGEIPFEFAVGNDGRLAQLWVLDPRYKSGPLRDCLEARLRAWAFDPFPGERPVVSLSIRVGR